MHNVDQNVLIEALAEELKTKIKMPEWAMFVKTGVHKDRPPVEKDWWYLRAGSVLRQVHLKGPVGVSKLRNKYGGRKNRGMKPEHFFKGSGKIIRAILQQLEEIKLVKQGQTGVHKGRILTPAGESLLFTVSKKLGTKVEKPKPVKVEAPAKKPETKPVEKKENPAVEVKEEPKEKVEEKVAEPPKEVEA